MTILLNLATAVRPIPYEVMLWGYVKISKQFKCKNFMGVQIESK